MTWRIATFSFLGMFVWALFGGSTNAAQKDQTQGQIDAHKLACANVYYACIGKCAQATSLPLIQACKEGCDGRMNTCLAAASATGVPQLNKEQSK
jgi:hypothetical protein